MTPELVVVGDVHLRSDGDAQVGKDLARLVRTRPGAHIVLLGDVFDLALEGVSPLESRLNAIARRHPEALGALREHLGGGGALTYVLGNHDHEMARPEGRAWLQSRVGVTDVRPWFVRFGEVHLEHGHQWDPDNAHLHPLSPGPDPLGVLLTRRFVSRLRDLRWLHESERTPLELLGRLLRRHRSRALALTLSYFRVALGAVAEAGAGARATEPSPDPAREQGSLDPRAVARLRALHPPPTLSSRWATWGRLYFTRVVVTLLLTSVALLAAAGLLPRAGWVLGAVAPLGVGLLAFGSPNRFRGSVGMRLAQGAIATARETAARIVVLGHAHRAATGPIYWNTGSFGLPTRGASRTFVEVVDGRATLQWMPVAGTPPSREEGACLGG